jgi:hypothetical protein
MINLLACAQARRFIAISSGFAGFASLKIGRSVPARDDAIENLTD